MTDHEIKSQILTAFAARPDLARFTVGVEVFDGRVFVVGSVDTLAQEMEAVAAAKSVPGVKEVLSALRVAETEPKEPPPVDDATLTRRVNAALLDHGIVLQRGRVIVAKREVYLNGYVRTPREKRAAEHIATMVDGVEAVHNGLHVARAT